jgi:MOSC domain-containing protein YiiM|tara:strand:+ start:344 stop:802 length:459 start_codon:yes stop_codon:yes gene_type:complete
MNKLLNMSRVLKLGLTNNNNQKIKEVSSFDVIANKGVIGDRHFKDYNDPYCQLSLIESENIDFYNTKYGLNISYIDFRRNIVTKGVELNNLVGKKFYIGNVEVEGIDLCRPCRHLNESLNQENIIKEFLRKGGLRCQILNSASIYINDLIKI